MLSFSDDESNPKAFVFGPQATSFDLAAFCKLRTQLQETPRFQWVLNTVAELSSDWNNISKSIAKLQDFSGEKLLEKLREWLRGAPIPEGSFPLPNILLSPLVVIAQLTKYSAFLASAIPDLNETHELPAIIKTSTETLGMCTGTLSALIVACSSNIADVAQYGGVAVRLAMLTGALVEAEEIARGTEDKSMSFSASWNADDSIMKNILKRFSEVNTIL